MWNLIMRNWRYLAYDDERELIMHRGVDKKKLKFKLEDGNTVEEFAMIKITIES